jgi:predicted nucleic acid-binding protein
MIYLLDTCVLSESRKKQISANVRKWLLSISDEFMYMSVLSVGEIRNGIERLPEIKRKEQLIHWLEYELPAWFGDRILSLDYTILNCWGKICAEYRTLPVIDSLFAATAIQHHLILATRNVKDFQDIRELQVVNPWD